MVADDPASCLANPILAFTSAASAVSACGRRRRWQRLVATASGILLLLLISYTYLGPAADLPVLEAYTYEQPPPFSHNPSPQPDGYGNGGHSHLRPPPPAQLDGSNKDMDAGDGGLVHAGGSTAALLDAQPVHLAAARSRYSLKTGRAPPLGFDAFFEFARARGCLVDGYHGVHAGFAPFWRAEMRALTTAPGGQGRRRGWFGDRVKKLAEKLKEDSRGITALNLSGGAVHHLAGANDYLNGDWAKIISKFVHALPPMIVLINGRDEPRVVFDIAPLFDDNPQVPSAVGSLADPSPFALSPPSTAEFFRSRPGCTLPRGVGVEFFRSRPGCTLPRGVGVAYDVPLLLSASSAEFTTDLVPVLSMTKLADGASGVAAGGAPEGGHTCFADIVIPGPFSYRNTSWAGQFKYPNKIRWEDKKDVLYWRGKSNGGHIRGNNYRSFPRFRLMDLAARPEHRAKNLFDPSVCDDRMLPHGPADNCDAWALRKEYNITEHLEPREDAYNYKYLFDIDGNTFSGRFLNLLRSGSLVFKSTAFVEFFTPWLIPYEHFIPVRPDLSDLPARIEWAKANDEEAHRIQEAGRVFAERVLTDAQNDCYWFAVMLEWGALWGEV
ncbi:glycosyl transferase family 90-domain-containing protein [Mycena capillaripes]|nr:glycosyl transferase family 90-domain-containing protein [Mycena capillaripes]